MKLYLASSWRNPYQSSTLESLRDEGFEVYDFKNPVPGNTGFSWRSCDPELTTDLTVDRMRKVLAHPVARQGFKYDFDAMKWADACVLLLPSGMSSHLEAGWMGGAGKAVAVLAPEIREPELMYKLFDAPEAGGVFTPIYATVGEVAKYLWIHCQ